MHSRLRSALTASGLVVAALLSMATSKPKKDDPKPATGTTDPKKEEPKKEDPKKEEPKTEQPPAQPPMQPRPMGGGFGGGFDPAFLRTMNEFLQTEGVAATLRDSNKPHGLLVMTGSWPAEGRGGGGGGQNAIPSLFITHEHYAMLYRLGMDKDGPKPKVELEVSNKFIPGPITVYNTVGEIRGSEKPDEFVVVGAHLDSWDLATGTMDNGTGSCVVLETARTLAKLAKAGQRPKRTIRFALFTGEEQGLYGSKQYAERHKDEMAKTSLALVHDTGTGKVYGFGVHGQAEVKAILDRELVTLAAEPGWKGIDMGGVRPGVTERRRVGRARPWASSNTRT